MKQHRMSLEQILKPTEEVMTDKFYLSGEIGSGENYAFYLKKPLLVPVTHYSSGLFECDPKFERKKDEKHTCLFFSMLTYGRSLEEAKSELKHSLIYAADSIFRSRKKSIAKDKLRCAELFFLRRTIHSPFSLFKLNGNLSDRLSLMHSLPLIVYNLIDRTYVDGKQTDTSVYRCHGTIGDSYHFNALLVGKSIHSEQDAINNFRHKLSSLYALYQSSKQDEVRMVSFKNKLLKISEGPFLPAEQDVLYHSVAGTLDKIIVPK